MSKAKRNHLRGQGSLVRAQFSRRGRKQTSLRTRAYSVSFTNAPPGPGRHSRWTYRTAIVIAVSPLDAAEKSERYCKTHWPKMHVEEIRLENDLVIVETDTGADADGVVAK